MTSQEMHALALKKWEWIVYNWDYDRSYSSNLDSIKRMLDYPGLYKYGSCSYCFIFYDNNCISCPLLLIKQDCFGEYGDYYSKWDDMRIKNNYDLATFWADMLRDTIRCLGELSYYEDKNRRAA